MELQGLLSCKEFVEVITEYLDGTLSPSERERIEAHLAGCRACRAYLNQMRLTIRVLGTIGDSPEAPVPAETKQRLVDLFRALKRD